MIMMLDDDGDSDYVKVVVTWKRNILMRIEDFSVAADADSFCFSPSRTPP